MPNKPIALITGGAQRIGKELTRTFHQLGYNIALHYNRSEQAATDLKSELESVRKNSTAFTLKKNLPFQNTQVKPLRWRKSVLK